MEDDRREGREWWMDELSFPRVIFSPTISRPTETAGVAAQTLGNLPTFAAS